MNSTATELRKVMRSYILNTNDSLGKNIAKLAAAFSYALKYSTAKILSLIPFYETFFEDFEDTAWQNIFNFSSLLLEDYEDAAWQVIIEYSTLLTEGYEDVAWQNIFTFSTLLSEDYETGW